MSQDRQEKHHLALRQIREEEALLAAEMSGEPPDSDNELWLVSYADLMTLLFGFFVLMYVFASQHTKSTVEMQSKLAEQFGSGERSYVEKQSDEIKLQIQSVPDLSDIEVYPDVEGVTLVFKTKLLFKPANAELTAEATNVLLQMIKQIREKIADAPITVEGHTDDRPLTSKTYQDNWELSAARAAAVVRVFENAGFDSSHLAATGFGASRPLAPNHEPDGKVIVENMDRNRRVAIRIRFIKKL